MRSDQTSSELNITHNHDQLLSWRVKHNFFSGTEHVSDLKKFGHELKLIILTAIKKIDLTSPTDIEQFLRFSDNISWLIRIDILTQSGKENQLKALRKWICLIPIELEQNHFALPEMIHHALQFKLILLLSCELPLSDQRYFTAQWLKQMQNQAAERINYAEAVIPHIKTVLTLFEAKGRTALNILQTYLADTKLFLQQYDAMVSNIKMAMPLNQSQHQLIEALQNQMLPYVLKLQDDGISLDGWDLTMLEMLLKNPIVTVPEFNSFRQYVKLNQIQLEDKIRLAKESLDRINKKYYSSLEALPTNNDIKINGQENTKIYQSLLKPSTPNLSAQLNIASQLINLSANRDIEEFSVFIRTYANKYRSYDCASQTVGAARKRFTTVIEPLATQLKIELEINHLKDIIFNGDIKSLNHIQYLTSQLVKQIDSVVKDPNAGKRLTALQLKQLAGKIGIYSDKALVSRLKKFKTQLLAFITQLNQALT